VVWGESRGDLPCCPRSGVDHMPRPSVMLAACRTPSTPSVGDTRRYAWISPPKASSKSPTSSSRLQSLSYALCSFCACALQRCELDLLNRRASYMNSASSKTEGTAQPRVTIFLRITPPPGQSDGAGDSGVVGTNRPVHIDAAYPTYWSCMRNQIFRAVARSLPFKLAHLLPMTLP
jgi:hypothetical protein